MRRPDLERWEGLTRKNEKIWVEKWEGLTSIVGRTDQKNEKVWLEKWEGLTSKSAKDWPGKMGRSESKNEKD